MADSQKTNPAEPGNKDKETSKQESKSLISGACGRMEPACSFVKRQVRSLYCFLCHIFPVAAGCLVFQVLNCMLQNYISEVEDEGSLTYMLSWNKLFIAPLLYGFCNVEYQQRTLVLAFMTLVNSLSLLSVLETSHANDVAAIVVVIVIFRMATLYLSKRSNAWYRFVEGPPILANMCMLMVNFCPKILDCIQSLQPEPDSAGSSWF